MDGSGLHQLKQADQCIYEQQQIHLYKTLRGQQVNNPLIITPHENDIILSRKTIPFIRRLKLIKFLLITVILTTLSNIVQSCGCSSSRYLEGYDMSYSIYTSWYSCISCSVISGCSNTPVWRFDVDDYWNYYTFMGYYECPPCVPNCRTCSDDVYCIQCYSGYVFDYNVYPPKCFLCSSISYCTSCSDGPVCETCSPGYMPNPIPPNKACMPCGLGNCASCDFVSGVLTCSSCFAGSVFDTSVSPQTCVSCSSISYCNTCVDGPSCTLCNSPYVLAPSGSNQICVPCSYITGCNSCVDGPSCTACTLPYVLDSSTYPQNCVTCSSVIPNCNSCTDGPLCTGCTSPYVLDTALSNSDPLVCVNCGTVFPNCNTCIDGPVCTLCDTPYVFDTSTSPMVCVPCSVITDCATCDDGPVCTSCSTFNWVRDLSTDNKKCVECLIQIPNCQTCVDGPKCSVCIPDYVVNYNNYNKSCVTCDYIPNCNTCVNGPVCTQCLAGLYLDFSTGNTSCASCNFYKCTQCTDGPRCIQCQPGFFLNSTYNLCMPCYFPCLTCDVSAISCTSCFSTNQLYYYDPGTKNCSLCYHNLTDCKACNMAGTQCTQCNSTLTYLDSSTKKCFPCTNNCQNCLTDLQCIDCISTNYAMDSISKQCKVCDSYMTRCLTCLTPSVCLTCNNTIYYLTYPPSNFLTQQDQCVTCQQARPKCVTCTSTVGIGPTCIQCQDKFYIDSYGCSHCPAPCDLCTSFTVCSSCVNTRYALNNSMCVLCNQLITNCLECSSSTMCTFCVNSTIPNPNGSGSKYLINVQIDCVPCGITQYPDQANQICRDCLTPCYSCLNATQCITCQQFYEYVPAIKGCKDICGDEVVVVDICDNGFGVIHDGCSNECTQDPDFTCKNYTTLISGQSVKESVCSYNLKVDIKILQIKKEPFKNTMSWKYYVTPYLYGLPGTTSRSFTLQQLKDTFLIREKPTVSTASASEPSGIGLQVKAGVTSTLTVENVEVNAAESTVTVTINYDADVKNSDIELFIDFGYLRNSLNLPNFDTTQDSDKLYSVSSYQFYSMIGRFYTQDQYYQSNILNKVSLAIGLMSFFAFIIGIFTKEVIGLQMAMLCQFVYISLFYFKGTLELPFFALRSLIYSTGYNSGFEGSYQQLDVNPPQSLVLSFDTTTFSNNFNIMAILYVLPLIIVIPFIPLKAKCIRKLTMIELGNKWVDLLLGEINLYGVLFNYQYFLFSLIVFYRDGRNSFNYPSSMIIWAGAFFTLCSFIGLILKPEIYGNFRSVFKYNKDLRSIDSKNGEKEVDLEEKLAKKFEGRGTCCYCTTSLKKKFRLFVNENYFWVNFRSLHTALTYNHYTLLIVYYTLTTLALTLIENSDLILVILSGILLLELILMRPYGKVSQKIRAIYFFIIYTGVSVIKFVNNQIIGGQYNFMLSALIVALLGVALIWTYYTLIRYFVKFFTELMSSRNVVVTKVFNSHLTDTFDKDLAAQQEQALIRKLMSRYERIELQYNLNNARGNLLSGYDMIIGQQVKKNHDNQEENAFVKIQSSEPKDKQNLFSKQLLEKVQQEQNYKNLKQIVQKQKKKRKKEQMKKRVTGQNLLKLLKLDNFEKYEKQYFTPEQQKRHNEYDQTDFKQQPQSLSIQTQQNQANQPKQAQDLGPCSEESQQKLSEKDEYESIEPQDFQEAKQKLDEQKIIIEQDQHIRYKRAAKIIASQGLTLDYDLIAQNYHNI